MPLHGVSMAYCFDDADAADRRQTQYFEILGNRGIYHRGWTAVTKHRTPWVVSGAMTPFDDDIWELYDTNTDWTQAHDLAREQPDRLRHMQRLFLLEASKYGVFPLDDRSVERFDAGLAGRPTLIRGTSQKLFPGMGRLTENTVLNLKNKSHSVTAEITVPDGGADGVIVAQGGAFAGWSLYLHEGRLTYCYNLLGLDRAKISSSEPVPAGTHQVRMEFTYDGGGLGRGGDVALYVDGDAGRHRSAQRHGPADLLRRRDVRRRRRHRLARQRRLHRRRRAGSPGPSAGCSSTSAATTTTTTSSPPPTAGESPWPASRPARRRANEGRRDRPRQDGTD